MNEKQFNNYNVVLSAIVRHYYYAALALCNSNHLERYICSIGIGKKNKWITKFIPGQFQKKIFSRDLSKIDSAKTKSIWLPEILVRGISKIGIISSERGFWLGDNLFDFIAKSNVIHCDIFHFVSGMGLYSAKKAKAKGSIIICDIRTVHPDFQSDIEASEHNLLGIPYYQQSQLNNNKVNAEYQLADYLIVPSKFTKKTFISAGYNPKTIYVVPYGVDLNRFYKLRENQNEVENNRKTPQQSTFRILFVGRVTPGKGVHYLIDAFNALKIEDAELILAGKIEKTMVDLVSKAVMNNQRIRAIGRIPMADLYQLYNSASIFVLPSIVDSWGLVVLEAMACGIPVIVTENTGSNEAVIEGENGYIIPIRETNLLKEKIIYLYEHQEIRQKMGKAALKRAKEFSWEKYGERLLHVYTDIYEKSNSKRQD